MQSLLFSLLLCCLFIWVLKAKWEFVEQGKRTPGGENKGRERLDEALQPVLQRGWGEGFRSPGPYEAGKAATQALRGFKFNALEPQLCPGASGSHQRDLNKGVKCQDGCF